LLEGVADVNLSVMMQYDGRKCNIIISHILIQYRVCTSWEKCDIMEPMVNVMEKWREIPINPCGFG